MTQGSCCASSSKNDMAEKPGDGCCGPEKSEKKGCGPCGLFKTNVGKIDRMIRMIIGLGLISLVFIGPQTPWGWVGVLLVISALLGRCELYRCMGITTKSCCSKDDKVGSCCGSKDEQKMEG